MRIWIDTDVGDDPDDILALRCAAAAPDSDIVGVSTVDDARGGRAALARALLPDVEVVANEAPPDKVSSADVLVGIGPWTNVASVADAGALPLRVVLMGGLLGRVQHHDEWLEVEHNVASDPRAAARLLATTGNLIVLPLETTARLTVDADDERAYNTAIPQLGGQTAQWRERAGKHQALVLHDPAAVLIALGELAVRTESRRLQVERDGRMLASVGTPIQQVVTHVDPRAVRARVRALVSG
jgi:inosine-uridine nucleoside N-ribohydrolase